MSWPDVHIPSPNGPTARDHLASVLKKAKDDKPRNLEDIDAAVHACLDGGCLPAGGGRGKPPRDDLHATSVLFARNEAERPRWDECLRHLRHGEAEEVKRKG